MNSDHMHAMPTWWQPAFSAELTGFTLDSQFLTVNTSPLFNLTNCIIKHLEEPESLPNIVEVSGFH